jgi:hypothetical protein
VRIQARRGGPEYPAPDRQPIRLGIGSPISTSYSEASSENPEGGTDETLFLARCIRSRGRCVRATAPPPPTTAAPPPSYATGSPSATTTFYDGTYIGSFVQNMSASGSGCPNFPVAPALTIRNGVAQFAALDLTYQGYVTPAGDVNMQTPAGQTFVGHIDPNYKLTGQTTGRCVYDATWQRRVGQKPS